ncbi:MAG: NAD-dependent epimerase/dehydratase family protein [Pseudomonadota bacterium]
MRPALPPDDLDKVLSLTASFWSQYGGARLFITGGTGFIGMWLLEVIKQANLRLGARMEAVVLSRNPAQAQAFASHLFNEPWLQLIEGDVSNFRKPTGRFDLCVHAAADVADGKKAGDHHKVFDSAVYGTRRVLDLAASSGAKKFLLTSSGAVYGVQPPTLELIPESFPGAPSPLDIKSAYGNGKRAAEWLSCEAANRLDFDASIARIFALVGPGLPLDGPFAAGNFIRDAIQQKPIHIQGDGRPVRSYLYMLDACVWLLHILMNGERGQAYNVGSENPISIAGLAEKIATAATDSPLPMAQQTAPQAGELTAPARYVPDTSRARKQLSLAQYTALDAALQKTVEWSRKAIQA